MNSLFLRWCTRAFRAFQYEFKTDWQFRVAVIALPLVVGGMTYLANNSYLIEKFL